MLGLVALAFLFVDLLVIGYLVGPAEEEDDGNCVGGQNLKAVVLIALPLAALLVGVIPVRYRRPWMRTAIMAVLLGAYVLVALLTQNSGPAHGEC